MNSSMNILTINGSTRKNKKQTAIVEPVETHEEIRPKRCEDEPALDRQQQQRTNNQLGTGTATTRCSTRTRNDPNTHTQLLTLYPLGVTLLQYTLGRTLWSKEICGRTLWISWDTLGGALSLLRHSCEALLQNALRRHCWFDSLGLPLWWDSLFKEPLATGSFENVRATDPKQAQRRDSSGKRWFRERISDKTSSEKRSLREEIASRREKREEIALKRDK